MVNVAVCGANGKMGQEVIKAVEADKNMSLVARIDIKDGEFATIKDAKNSVNFDNAEIIELHHNQKKDAPSGTAVKTALMMAGENTNFTTGNCQEVETIKGARGANSYNNIHIHSVRMPGYIASQEVIFGASGQILTIRHDSMNRECYMDGVLRAVRFVNENKEFIYGLENILD